MLTAFCGLRELARWGRQIISDLFLLKAEVLDPEQVYIWGPSTNLSA
jgi:hypothetical protein